MSDQTVTVSWDGSNLSINPSGPISVYNDGSTVTWVPGTNVSSVKSVTITNWPSSNAPYVSGNNVVLDDSNTTVTSYYYSIGAQTDNDGVQTLDPEIDNYGS